MFNVAGSEEPLLETDAIRMCAVLVGLPASVRVAGEWVAPISTDFCDPTMPPEVRRLGRTIGRWAYQIVAWHNSHMGNGPTEAINNLAKPIRRVAFGLANFRHHRIRCLLYAGKPNWQLLNTIQP